MEAVDYITKQFQQSEIKAKAHADLTFQEIREELNTQNISLKRKVEELQDAMDATVQTVVTAADIEEVLHTLLNRAMMAVNARIGSIMLPDEKSRSLSIVAAVGLEKSIVNTTSVRMGEGISGKVAQSGEGLLVKDVEQDPVFRKSNDHKYETPSFICLPLRTHKQVIGVLNLSRKRDLKAFSNSDLKYLNSLLTHISLAVENATLLKGVKETTQKLQQAVGEQSLRLIEFQQQALLSMEISHQAQKIEAMGTLAGGIAHNFNNLLMGIQGRTSLMLMDIDPSHLFYEHLKGIEEQVVSAANLTKQLLGFARRGKYEVKSTDLNELIKKTSERFGRTKKEITIHSRFQEDLWAAEIDREQIEQVMMNLYINAWQALPGSGDLILETQNARLDKDFSKLFSVREGQYVKISVTDNGSGMDEATRQRIFEPFYTTKEIGQGIGLGLASTYGIIKNHDGLIDVYSVKGEGTTFDIYLPASEKRISGTKRTTEDILMGNEMILLVDDENLILEVGKKILDKLGYKVIVAKSGQEAIEIYKTEQRNIDMVTLDMIMPDMDGKMAYEKLKEINPAIKVLLSSGYSITGEAQEILDKGCNEFIQKPYNLKDLSLKLREILD